MTALAARKAIQGILGVEQDGDVGARTLGALDKLVRLDDGAAWPPAAPSARHWTPEVVGDDLWVRNVKATCFGGSGDAMDSGDTASDVSTRKHPNIRAVSLPMRYAGPDHATRAALGGSPLPMMHLGLHPDGTENPDGAHVELFKLDGTSLGVFPCIDLGPNIARFPDNAIDLTLALARVLDPNATANNFEARVTYRLIHGAKHLLQPA